MGLSYRVYLDQDAADCEIYTCSKCKCHLSTYEQLISKNFHGVHGKAFLFADVVNIVISRESEERMMTTGKHIIRYISCSGCDKELGWQYASIKAYESDQVYKEGKFILEKCGIAVLSTMAHTKYCMSK